MADGRWQMAAGERGGRRGGRIRVQGARRQGPAGEWEIRGRGDRDAGRALSLQTAAGERGGGRGGRVRVQGDRRQEPAGEREIRGRGDRDEGERSACRWQLRSETVGARQDSVSGCQVPAGLWRRFAERKHGPSVIARPFVGRPCPAPHQPIRLAPPPTRRAMPAAGSKTRAYPIARRIHRSSARRAALQQPRTVHAGHHTPQRARARMPAFALRAKAGLRTRVPLHRITASPQPVGRPCPAPHRPIRLAPPPTRRAMPAGGSKTRAHPTPHRPPHPAARQRAHAGIRAPREDRPTDPGSPSPDHPTP
jgi:hypothetical protein